MGWELPNDFKYGIYSDGNYLGTHKLFKLDGVCSVVLTYINALDSEIIVFNHRHHPSARHRLPANTRSL